MNAPVAIPRPVGLLAELTHRCPLGCPYCSNPLELDSRSGELDTATWLRVFSEGTRAVETAEEARRRRLEGGEDDSASRNVARYAKAVAQRYLPNWTVALIYRVDRFRRAGDRHLSSPGGGQGQCAGRLLACSA